MRWSVAMRQAVGYNEPRRPWSTRTHLFRVSPASKLVRRRFQEAEPRRLSGTASVWCWFALVTGCRERFDTLWLADDVSTACWPFKKASWQYYDMQVLHQCQAAEDSARPCTYIGERDTLESEVGEATLGHLSTLFYMTMQERLLTNPEPHMHATEWSMTGRVTRTAKL